MYGSKVQTHKGCASIHGVFLPSKLVLQIGGGTNHDILRRSDWFLHGGIVACLISPKREFESPCVAMNKVDKPTLYISVGISIPYCS